jgi:very-short-patch-repair endonuclease
MSAAPPTADIKAQVETLRRKLLDLSLRNRMLNYRPSKRLGITVTGEDSFFVHKLLVEDGKKLSFVGKPDPAPKDRAPTDYFSIDDEVAVAQAREAAEDELNAFLINAAAPVDQLDTKLTTDEFESTLQAKLRTIAREADLANDELGINTLFLILGMLEWRETEQRSYMAPLIFVPVRLERQANGSMRLVHDGSDIGTNLPLRAKLHELNLALPDIDEDKSLLDYYSEVESTIRLRQDWHVHRNHICLGFFNYEKYAMYVDLGGETWPENRKPWNVEDIIALLGGGYSSVDSMIHEGTLLDEVRPVPECHEVYDADSSQTLAMIRVAERLSIVVEGPPGTGKSQTITNIIAEAVAAGRTVLFVSAKRAALEVVKRRLDEADLGAMCLDLHDKLTNRREFYAEIKRTVSRSLTLRQEEEKVARLTELRDRLNAHSAAMNEPLPEYEITPFEAMGRLARLPTETAEDREGRISFDKLKRWKQREISFALPNIEALQSRVRMTGPPSEHPFWGAEIQLLDPGRRLDLEVDLEKAEVALAAARTAMGQAAELLRIDPPLSPDNMRVLRVCADQAAAAPPHEGVAIKTARWRESEDAVRKVIHLIEERAKLKQTWATAVRESFWSADLNGISQHYEGYADRWYRFVVAGFRRARAELQAHLTEGASSDAQEQRRLVRDGLRVQECEREVEAAVELMQRHFGVQWQGLETDPSVLERLLDWALNLHDQVQAGSLPPGLLDFFEGNLSSEAVAASVRDAEQAVEAGLQAYLVAAGHLRFTTDDAAGLELEALTRRTQMWRQSLDRLPAYMEMAEARRRVLEEGFAPVVELADRWPLAGERLSDAFLRSYYSGVVREAMERRPELRTFERNGHEAAIAEFQTLDDFKLKYNRAQVRIAHHRRLPTFDHAHGNLALLKVQCELQRKHKPIRWIMARAGEAIQRIKPVFMMSPLSVAIHLPPELPPFDLVIFDEASQIKPEDALCAIARAKQAVVVGDTQQMPPTSFFDRQIDEDEELDSDSEDMAALEFGAEARKLESILSMMSAVTIGRTRRPDLRWHYRSLHPALIQPSNEMFYESRLVVFPSPSPYQNGRRIGVQFHHHPETVYEGGARRRINRLEAEIVAQAVHRHVLTHPDESLLVAAMNKPQADLIWEEVSKRERQDPGPYAAYRQRHPHEPLDIKNLENVQGDERDVVFISVTYGRDASGVIRQHFGPLLLDGGERRLNVLITRARRRCEVFSNMTADDIRLATPRAGVESLKRYLRFAASGSLDVAVPTGEGPESPFEEEVAAALWLHGWEFHAQVGSEGYRIDLAVLDPEAPGRYLLGIECDGATYHSARSARDRDKLRQRVLESRGWKLHRIWSHDWWQDREGEMSRLLAALEDRRAEIGGIPDPDESSSAFPSEDPTPAAPLLEESERTGGTPPRTRPYVQAPDPLVPLETDEQLGAYLLNVVEAEGPICEELLIQRLRAAAGIGRAGVQVRARMDAIIASRRRQFRSLAGAYFWEDRQLLLPRDWSARPAAEKKTEYLPEVELAAALKCVVGASFGIQPEAAARAAYTLMGFRRVSDAALAKGQRVLRKMIEQGGLTTRDGLLFPPQK